MLETLTATVAYIKFYRLTDSQAETVYTILLTRAGLLKHRS